MITVHCLRLVIVVADGSFMKQMTLNVDLDLSNVNSEIVLNICAKVHENLTCTFREITTSVMNKRTNEPTNKQSNTTIYEGSVGLQGHTVRVDIILRYNY